jgi:alpha-beta hydrolase superfamily lysophospholipase
MIGIKSIWRTLCWGFAAAGLASIVGVSLLAVPLSQPPELTSIYKGALAVDRTGMPELSRFQARDGSMLAYRFYPAADGSTDRIAFMIHGSVEGSSVVNEIAKRFAAENYAVVAPDIRGHGGSGTHGDIAYFGQLDDDATDLVAELRRLYPKAHFGLVGFSAGGGLALRLAAGNLASTFDRVVLVSPALGPFAPSTRSSSGSARWVNLDLPRIIALSALRRLGLPCCESLPIVAFATAPESGTFVTSQYSYRLASNFGAPHDLDAAFHSLASPTTILAGAQDELMASDRYADIVRGIAPKIDVQILPGLGHMDMVHVPAALDAIIAAFRQVTTLRSEAKPTFADLAKVVVMAGLDAPLSWLWSGADAALHTIGILTLVASALLAVPVSRPPELASISAARNAIDTNNLPNLSRYQARDGSELAHRFYPAADGNTQKIAIVIHGSGGASSGMNAIARGLAGKDFAVVVPDMRGFGGSGTRGDIGYIGQLDDDIEDLVAELRRQFPEARLRLLGFSSGGGFALRVASGKLSTAFDRLVLLAPYLGSSAPSTKSRKTSARWANANVPRFIALTFLQRFGVRMGESLPVIAFAVPPDSEAIHAAQWSYRLLVNFGAPADLASAFRRLKSRTVIIAAGADELIASDKFADIVKGIEPKIAVTILPGLRHMDMLHAPAALDTACAALARPVDCFGAQD